MPDKNGKLTEADQKKAVDWLNSKTKFHNCPSCGENNWTVGPELLNFMPYTGGGLVIGGPTYPVAFIVCNSCAYIKQYMAIPMGIIGAGIKADKEND